MIGGIDPRMHIKNPIPSTDSFVYDIKCNAWIKIMPMNTARMYHSLCSLCGMVYAIGGQDGDNRYCTFILGVVNYSFLVSLFCCKNAGIIMCLLI